MNYAPFVAALIVAVFCFAPAYSALSQSQHLTTLPKSTGNYTYSIINNDDDDSVYLWTGVWFNNTVDNINLIEGSSFDVNFIPSGSNETINKWHYVFTNVTEANASADQAFPPIYADAGGNGAGDWMFTFVWNDVEGTNTTSLAAFFQVSLTYGELKFDEVNSFGIVAPGMVLPMNITNTTEISMTFAAHDGGNINDMLSMVTVYKQCENVPPVCLEAAFTVNGTEAFNITSLQVDEYYVEFSSPLAWDAFDPDNKIDVSISTSVEQAQSSSESDGGSFLGLPNWVWYTLIGVVVVLALLLIVAAVVGLIAMRKKNSYDSV